MVRFNQRNPKWYNVTIGNTDIPLGKMGCTICSVCAVHSDFYPKDYITPPEAAKEWYFIDSGKLAASIHWAKTDFTGMNFEWRQRGYKKEKDYQKVAAHANNPYLGVIIQVDNVHWVAVKKAILGEFIIMDPWYGHYKWLRTSPYKEITGYALFTKKLPD